MACPECQGEDCESPLFAEVAQQVTILENAILIVAGAMRDGKTEYALRVLKLQEQRILADRASVMAIWPMRLH
jgi:hypothetical protein